MRRSAYVCSLIGTWLAGLAALVLGLDSIQHPPFIPLALVVGAYWAAVCSVLLAEEAADWMARRRAALTGEFTMAGGAPPSP
jgi:hypothetical protein